MCLVLFRVLYWHIFICNFWVQGADTVFVDPTIVQHADYKELSKDHRGDVSIKESGHPIVKRYAQVVESSDYVDTENNSKTDNPNKPVGASEILNPAPVGEDSVNESEHESTNKQPMTESPNQPITDTDLLNADYGGIAVKLTTGTTNEPDHNTNVTTPATTDKESVAESKDKDTKKEPDTESPTELVTNTTPVNVITVDESDYVVTKKSTEAVEEIKTVSPTTLYINLDDNKTVNVSYTEGLVTESKYKATMKHLKTTTKEPVEENKTIIPTTSYIKPDEVTAKLSTSIPIIVNPTGSKKELCLTQKQSLLEFGKSYGKRLKTWLSDMGRIHLSSENSTYQQAKLVGKIKVERGYMNINTNIVFQPSRFRYHKLQQLPMRAVKGVEVIFQFLVPSIDIHYNYSQEAFLKKITGTFDVVLTNQLVVMSMIATKNEAGKCYAEDRTLDITFNVRDIKVRFKVNGGGFMSQGVSYVGEKVINTYIIKRLLPLKVKRAMLGKLEEIRLASKLHNAHEFYTEMDSALCNGIDLYCV